MDQHVFDVLLAKHGKGTQKVAVSEGTLHDVIYMEPIFPYSEAIMLAKSSPNQIVREQSWAK